MSNLSPIPSNSQSRRDSFTDSSYSRPRLGISLANLKITSRKGSADERAASPSLNHRRPSSSNGYRTPTLNKSDSCWNAITLAVLPLFNGEVCNSFESLNELVKVHINTTLAKCTTRNPSNTAALAAGIITSELNELFSTGILTLSSKLTDSNLNEIWSFFFSGGLLSSIEGIFYPLRYDTRVRGNLEEEGRTQASSGRVMPRKLALTAFRDGIVLPMCSKLEVEFLSLYSTSATPSEILSKNKSRQMVYVLGSVLTGDSRQQEIENLMSIMRGGPRRVPEVSPSAMSENQKPTEGEAEEFIAESIARRRSVTLESNSTADVVSPTMSSISTTFYNTPNSPGGKKLPIPLLRRLSRQSKVEDKV